jgi:hypothetical protein
MKADGDPAKSILVCQVVHPNTMRVEELSDRLIGKHFSRPCRMFGLRL